jgi:hypothetical protein
MSEMINRQEQQLLNNSLFPVNKETKKKKPLIWIFIFIFFLITIFIFFFLLKQQEKVNKKIREKEIMEKFMANNQELSKDELKFIYEVDSYYTFNTNHEENIKKIKLKRDLKKDLAFIFDCSKDEISLNQEEALSGNIKFHYGSLYLDNFASAKDLDFPEIINGYLNLQDLISAKGLVLPRVIGGYLQLDNLASAKDLILPEIIGGDLYLRGLISTKDLVPPKTIGGDFYLNDTFFSVKDLYPLIRWILILLIFTFYVAVAVKVVAKMTNNFEKILYQIIFVLPILMFLFFYLVLGAWSGW